MEGQQVKMGVNKVGAEEGLKLEMVTVLEAMSMFISIC